MSPKTVDAFIEIIHPDDRAQVLAAIHRTHDPSGDGQYETEYRIAPHAGVVRWVLAMGQTTFDGEGGSRRPLRTVGATLEITARKLAEEAFGVRTRNSTSASGCAPKNSPPPTCSCGKRCTPCVAPRKNSSAARSSPRWVRW
jgi:hypothetical protein